MSLDSRPIVYTRIVLTTLQLVLCAIPKCISTVIIINKTDYTFQLGKLCLKLIHVNTMASAVDMRVEWGEYFHTKGRRIIAPLALNNHRNPDNL